MPHTVTVQLYRADRLPNSVNGNPRYRLITSGGPFTMQSDVSDVYAVTNFLPHSTRRPVSTVVLTLNRSGRVSGIAWPVLDCGHAATERDGIGTGQAYDEDGRTYCYPCADDRERQIMRASASHLAYISSTGARVTTWSGGTLARVTGHSVARTGWHGSEVWRWWAESDDGARWYGANGGAGMCINMRRLS